MWYLSFSFNPNPDPIPIISSALRILSVLPLSQKMRNRIVQRMNSFDNMGLPMYQHQRSHHHTPKIENDPPPSLRVPAERSSNSSTTEIHKNRSLKPRVSTSPNFKLQAQNGYENREKTNKRKSGVKLPPIAPFDSCGS